MAHSSKSSNRPTNAPRPVIETLEERQLLSAAIASTSLLNPSVVMSQAANVTPAVGSTSTTTVVHTSAVENSSIYSNAVILTAVVTGATPTGTVTFFDGSTNLGAGTAGLGGTWTLSISTLNAASHSITAVYGGDSNNITSTSTAVALTVTPKALNVTGITASNKTYDTTTVATLNTGGAALSGVFGDDTVVLHTGGAAGAFANANAGTDKAITVTGFTITGASAANYTLTQPIGVTATISAKTVTLSGVTAVNSIYNGTTTASLDFSQALISGLFLSDDANVTLSTANTHATFANANVGTAKLITITGITLTGSAAANYTITQPSGLTANVTARPLTITGVTASNKAYDGTATATLNAGHAALSGVVTADAHNVTLTKTNLHGTFADANAGAGKSVTVTGFSLSGSAALNYTLTAPSPTATITPKALTIAHVTASNKEYNGTTTATLGFGSATLSGILTADALNVGISNVTGVFSTANVGTNKITVTVTLSGTAAANYVVSNPSLSAKITAKTLTVTGLDAADKVYDGTTSGDLDTTTTALVGVVDADVAGGVFLNFSGASATFASKNAANNIIVTFKGVTLSGTAAKNYILATPIITPGSVTANITPKAITISGLIGTNKTYDGSTAADTIPATTLSLNGVLSADKATAKLTGTATGTFANANVGNGKVITITGLSLTGANSANYTLTIPSVTGNITPRALGVGFITANKIYDGTTTATLDTSDTAFSNLVPADASHVTLDTSDADVTDFTSANAGTYSLTVSGLTISGTAASNYTLTQPTISATISAKALTITGITASDKTYNGNANATIDASGAIISGILNADLSHVTLVTSGATGAFADANAGDDKTVTISGLTLTGTAAANYTITAPTATATINQRTLTISGITANNKVYDGTTDATLNTSHAAISGILASDLHNVTFDNLTATFEDANAATGIAVDVSVTLNGSAGGNYVVDDLGLTANITPATVTVTGIAATKAYDGTTAATLDFTNVVFHGEIEGDDLSLSGNTGTFASSSVGTGIAVTPTGIILTGDSSGNYVLTAPTGLTGTITQATLTVSGLTAVTKTYDGTNAATIDTTGAELSGIVGSEDVSISSVTGTFDSVNATTSTPNSVTISHITLTGANAANYVITLPTDVTGIINAKALTVTGITASDKDFDGTTAATIDTTGAELSGVVTADLSNVGLDTSDAVGNFDSSLPGTDKTVFIDGLALTGSAASNYTLDQATTTASILVP